MRQIARLFALGLMVALFHRLTAPGALEARATLALGFLLVVAPLGGDLAKRVRLPRITGFLLTGFAVGPAWLGLVRADELAALGFIADAAVSLIAFAAGTELRLRTLRREGVALARVSAAAIAAPFVAVTLVTLSVSRWFPVTVHQPLGDAVAVALVLGVVAAASSPSLTMAVIAELGARGRFARSVLGVTVAKDVSVIALFALALAVARPLASAGALDVTVARRMLAQLGGSLAVGVVLGYVVAQYLKAVQRDTVLFLVALAFVTAEVARLLGLETMLIALAAGFYVENSSRVQGERVVTALARGSLPVYVLFFALAGAGLGVEGLSALWPWVLLLVGLRALGLYYGLRWAGRSPAVTPVLAQYGWLGLISQAGVTLGLAGVARRAFPEWGVSLETLIVAMIGVHEVAGPICFRHALRARGEVAEGEHVTNGVEARGPGVALGRRSV